MSSNDEPVTFYEFKANDLDGNEISMERYRGTVLIIINVASNCGLAKTNFKELNQLYEKLHDQGFNIAAFPSNSFGGESGCNSDIKEFVLKNEIKFDMYEKVDVNGDSAHPIFKWLKSNLHGTLGLDFIKWNFTKFLLDRNGNPVKRFGPTTNPSHIEPDIVSLI